MRQADVVSWDYRASGGVEQVRLEKIFSYMYHLADQLSSETVTDELLLGLTALTEEKLESEGLLNPSDYTWVQAVNYIRRASQKDSSNRRNPPASRIITRAAYLKIVEREVITRLAREKGQNVFEYLEAVRVGTRTTLEDAIADLADIGGFGGEAGRWVYHQAVEDVEYRDALEINEVVRSIAHNLSQVQAAPYLLPAKTAEALLIGTYGKTNEQEDRFKEILRYGGGVGVLANKSAEGYLRGRNVWGARKRMEQSISLLNEVLNDHDYSVYTVFSPQNDLS